jgi:hypothetical protein
MNLQNIVYCIIFFFYSFVVEKINVLIIYWGKGFIKIMVIKKENRNVTILTGCGHGHEEKVWKLNVLFYLCHLDFCWFFCFFFTKTLVGFLLFMMIYINVWPQIMYINFCTSTDLNVPNKTILFLLMELNKTTLNSVKLLAKTTW